MAVLISGSGTTLQNLIDHRAAGTLDVEIVTVISSRAGVYGLERARLTGYRPRRKALRLRDERLAAFPQWRYHDFLHECRDRTPRALDDVPPLSGRRRFGKNRVTIDLRARHSLK